jgi:hypothetical protein
MTKYTRMILELLQIGDLEKLSQKIHGLAKKGVLDTEFIQYMEDCIAGKKSEQFDAFTLRALLFEIKRTVYIPPKLPAYMSDLFNKRIHDVLNPPNVYAVERLLAELKDDGLLNAQFGAIFRNALENGSVSALNAQEYWEMCLECMEEEEKKKLADY